MRNTKQCSMTYRQSENYNRAKYFKNLPPQFVSSRSNLQVVDKFRKHTSFFYSQRGNVGVLDQRLKGAYTFTLLRYNPYTNSILMQKWAPVWQRVGLPG